MGMQDDVKAFVQATAGVDPTGRVALFEAVRAMPYATDRAHTAAELVRVGRGDCLAKSELLVKGFRLLNLPARRVRWLYELPLNPPEVQLLPAREDIHSAAEVQLDGRWALVDATHDPPLAAGGPTVADWDGSGDTVGAYARLGPLWPDGADDDAVAAALARIEARFKTSTSLGFSRYSSAFNAWLASVRAS